MRQTLKLSIKDDKNNEVIAEEKVNEKEVEKEPLDEKEEKLSLSSKEIKLIKSFLENPQSFLEKAFNENAKKDSGKVDNSPEDELETVDDEDYDTSFDEENDFDRDDEFDKDSRDEKSEKVEDSSYFRGRDSVSSFESRRSFGAIAARKSVRDSKDEIAQELDEINSWKKHYGQN